MNRQKELSIKFIIGMVSILVVYYIIINNIGLGYEKLYILPLLFFAYNILGSDYKKTFSGGYLFQKTLYIYVMIRYLILPYSIVKQSYYYYGYAKIIPSTDSFRTGINIMIAELLVIIALSMIFKNKNNIKTKKIVYSNNLIKKQTVNNNVIYLFFIGLTIIITILNPSIIKSVSVLGFEGRTATDNILDKWSSEVLIISKTLLFFIIIKTLKYKNKNNSKVLGSYIVSILNIIIYKGRNKKNVLMTGLASIGVLNKYFKDKIKSTIIILLSVTILTFGLINAYRSVNSSKNFKLPELDAHRIQIYFSGPYNMALAVETKEMNDKIDVAYRINDYLRPFLGIGSILKKYNIPTSTDSFNERISLGGPKRGDQIMPISGQGLLHFGYYFFYIYIVIILILGFTVDNKPVESMESIESIYLNRIFAMILGQFLGLNIVILINKISFTLIPIYFLNKLNNKIIFKETS